MRVCESIVCRVLRIVTLLRIRHRYGHGVHSPFAYGLVREVYMNRQKWIECVGMPMYEAMMGGGLTCVDAAVIQRLYDYAGASGFDLNGCAEPSHASECDNIISVYTVMGAVLSLSEERIQRRITVIIDPRDNLSRYEMCRGFIKSHNGLSMDCRSMMLFFHYPGLSKEHIKL